jgi:zinc protease
VATSPTASVWVWYRVGSRNEWPGVTGASHWVEHMLFQGSPKYGKGEIDRAIVSVGGVLNAFTDTDFTAYFSIVPREHLDVPLAIEADRMTRALIDPVEVERERTIIHSEREGNENWPEFRAEEELYALAFRVHPYRWDPLGFRTDIEQLTPAALASYYRRFYGPKNAILVVSGGFDASELRRRIPLDFGPIPEVGDDPRVDLVEPPARGERRSTLTGPGTTPFVRVGWRAPAFNDVRTPALVILDTILGGENRFFTANQSWFRTVEHPSSRLFQQLVVPGLAVRAGSEYRPRIDPGLYIIHAQAAHGVSLDRLEAALHAELGRFARQGPTRQELEDARTKVRRGAELAYEGASRSGFRLGYFATMGGKPTESELLARVLRVRSAEVRDAARKLFVVEQRCVVRYEPTESGPI